MEEEESSYFLLPGSRQEMDGDPTLQTKHSPPVPLQAQLFQIFILNSGFSHFENLLLIRYCSWFS